MNETDESTLNNGSESEASRHQSFARKLMELEAMRQSGPEAGEAGSRPAAEWRPSPTIGHFHAGALEASLEEARRRASASFLVYGAMLGLLGAVALAGFVFFAFSLLAGSHWSHVLASGGVLVGAIGLFSLTQYWPPLQQRATQLWVARLEAAGLSLDRSMDFWDAFFRFRHENGREIAAAEVAAAVSSLSAAAQELLPEPPVPAPNASQPDSAPKLKLPETRPAPASAIGGKY